MKEIKLHIRQYIGDEILGIYGNTLEHKAKTALVIAAMGLGKTTAVMKILSDTIKTLVNLKLENETRIVFIAPKKTLLDEVANKYKCNKVYGDNKSYIFNEKNICTTPDSLYKVIAGLEENNCKYILIYDEVHKAFLDYSFRKKLNNPFQYIDYQNCNCLIGLTATGGFIKDKFDIKFDITSDTKIKLAKDKVNIINVEGLNNEIIIKKALKNISENGNTQVIRLNNKEKLKELEKAFNKLNLTVTLVHSELAELEDKEKLKKIIEGKPIETDIFLCTSILDEGVNLNCIKEHDLIIPYENNCCIIDLMQFCGRFRNGSNEISILHNLDDKNLNYEEAYEHYLNVAIAMQNVQKECGLDIDLNSTKFVNSDNTINYQVIEEKALKVALKYETKNIFKLKMFLENDMLFKDLKIETSNKLELEKNENIESMILDLAAAKKEEKKIKSEKLKEFDEFILTTLSTWTDRDIEIFINKKVQIQDTWIIEPVKDKYDYYHSPDNKENRKLYYQLSESLNLKPRFILQIIYDKNKLKEYNVQKNIIIAYANFNNRDCLNHLKDELLTTDLKHIKSIIAIRESIVELKGKEINIRLSNKFKNELLEYLQTKKKGFKKFSAKKLDKTLQSIYKFKDTEKNIISKIVNNFNL